MWGPLWLEKNPTPRYFFKNSLADHLRNPWGRSLCETAKTDALRKGTDNVPECLTTAPEQLFRRPPLVPSDSQPVLQGDSLHGPLVEGQRGKGEGCPRNKDEGQRQNQGTWFAETKGQEDYWSRRFLPSLEGIIAVRPPNVFVWGGIWMTSVKNFAEVEFSYFIDFSNPF